MRLRKRDTSGELKTWAIIDGVEQDVCVYWESSNPEPDVDWAGGLVINAYYEDGSDASADMSLAELADLLERVERDLGEYDDDGYGDYLYDQRKDDRGNEP